MFFGNKKNVFLNYGRIYFLARILISYIKNYKYRLNYQEYSELA